MSGAPDLLAHSAGERATTTGQEFFRALDDLCGASEGIAHSSALELRADCEALLRRLRQLRVFVDRP